MNLISTLLLLSLTTLSLSQPTPTQPSLKSVTFAGTGCPSTSSSLLLFNPPTSLSLSFRKFKVATDVGPTLDNRPPPLRSNCQVGITIQHAVDQQIRIEDFLVVGLVDLEKGLSALLRSTAYFAAQPGTLLGNTTFTGPFYGDFETNLFPDPEELWSVCGRTESTLNLNIQLEIRNSTVGGTVDRSLERYGEINLSFLRRLSAQTEPPVQRLGVGWRGCE